MRSGRLWIEGENYCFGQKRISGHLLDYGVGTSQQAIRRIYAECFGDLEIDNKLKFRCILNRQISWLLAFLNPVHIRGGLLMEIDVVDSVKCQPATHDPIVEGIDGGQFVFCGKGDDQIARVRWNGAGQYD